MPGSRRAAAGAGKRGGAKGLSKGEQTRRAIISQAVGVVSEVGYEGLSIGALAERTKLSKSGLFAHFKSKEALQLAVMQEVIDQFIARVVQPGLAAPRGEVDGLVLRDVQRALYCLPVEQREVMLLVCVEEMSYQEASVVLNVPTGTVMSRLSRAREHMRVLLGEEPGRKASPSSLKVVRRS